MWLKGMISSYIEAGLIGSNVKQQAGTIRGQRSFMSHHIWPRLSLCVASDRKPTHIGWNKQKKLSCSDNWSPAVFPFRGPNSGTGKLSPPLLSSTGASFPGQLSCLMGPVNLRLTASKLQEGREISFQRARVLELSLLDSAWPGLDHTLWPEGCAVRLANHWPISPQSLAHFWSQESSQFYPNCMARVEGGGSIRKIRLVLWRQGEIHDGRKHRCPWR